MQLEIEGFILSEIPFGETSKIINVYTKEKGLIGIMCKGAKSMKSKYRVATGAFNYCLFNLRYNDNKLSNLISADVINPLLKIKSDLLLMSFVTYLSELTSQVIKQTSKNIYDDFINVILKINDGLDPLILTNILELKYLPLLGVEIKLDECILCGGKKDIVTIDASYGGLICKNCFTNSLILPKKVIQLLRMYFYVDIKSISSIKVDDDLKLTINKFINDYYDTFTGIYINSKKFLESLL